MKKSRIEAEYEPRNIWGDRVKVITHFSGDVPLDVVIAAAHDIAGGGGQPFHRRYQVVSVTIIAEEIADVPVRKHDTREPDNQEATITLVDLVREFGKDAMGIHED